MNAKQCSQCNEMFLFCVHAHKKHCMPLKSFAKCKNSTKLDFTCWHFPQTFCIAVQFKALFVWWQMWFQLGRTFRAVELKPATKLNTETCSVTRSCAPSHCCTLGTIRNTSFVNLNCTICLQASSSS